MAFLIMSSGVKFPVLETGGDGMSRLDVAEGLELRIDDIVIVDPRGCNSNGGTIWTVHSLRRCDALRRGHFADQACRQEGSNAQRLTNGRVNLVHLAEATLCPDNTEVSRSDIQDGNPV